MLALRSMITVIQAVFITLVYCLYLLMILITWVYSIEANGTKRRDDED